MKTVSRPRPRPPLPDARPARHVKVAISLGVEEFRKVEALRRRRGTSRSGVIREALQSWFARDQEAADERRYVESYRKYPESADPEAVAWAQIGLEMLKQTEWE